MQQWSPDGVRQERTGWRDEAISRRHREWGFNCPAVDLDFLVAEYNIGKPVGLVEYKHCMANLPNIKHPTYRALSALADGYSENGVAFPLPFLVARYWPDIWAMQILPVNRTAGEHFGLWEMLTERDYVRRLYKLRRLTLTRELEGKLLHLLPQEAA